MTDFNYRKQQLQEILKHEKTLEGEHGILEPGLPILYMDAKAGTEPCQNGESELHDLDCGHIIHTEQKTVCGRNCCLPIENFAPFACMLCERQKMIRSGQTKHRSTRVTELILPSFPDFDQSHVPSIMRARECNIALEQSSETMSIFHQPTPMQIARLRVMDNRHLDHILDDMTDAAKDMGFSQAAIEDMEDELITCVDHQHLWVSATYEQLATAVLYIAAVQTGCEQPWMLEQLARCLQAPFQGIQELLPRAVSVLLIDTRAKHAIASFMPILENNSSTSRKHSKDLTRLVLKLWNRTPKHEDFVLRFMANNWRCVVVCCIFAVTTVNDIFLTTEEISAALRHCGLAPNAYLPKFILSIIVYDKAYRIKNLEVKRRRQRKLRARRTWTDPCPAVVVAPAPDLVVSLLQGFEMISFNEYVGVDPYKYLEGLNGVQKSRDGFIDGLHDTRKKKKRPESVPSVANRGHILGLPPSP
jgi:hypothetical protein